MDSYFSYCVHLPFLTFFYSIDFVAFIIEHLYHFVISSMYVFSLGPLAVHFEIAGTRLACACLLLFSVPFKY